MFESMRFFEPPAVIFVRHAWSSDDQIRTFSASISQAGFLMPQGLFLLRRNTLRRTRGSERGKFFRIAISEF